MVQSVQGARGYGVRNQFDTTIQYYIVSAECRHNSPDSNPQFYAHTRWLSQSFHLHRDVRRFRSLLVCCHAAAQKIL